MTDKIRLYSLSNGQFSHRCYNLGCVIDGQHLTFPIGELTARNRNDIKFFDIPDNYLGVNKTAKEIAVELFKQNNRISYQKARGWAEVQSYNTEWTIEYREDLDSWFTENNIPYPIERRSLSEQMQAQTDKVLSHYGLKPQGQAAIEAAKNAKAVETSDALAKEIAKLQELVEAQSKKLAELEAAKAPVEIELLRVKEPLTLEPAQEIPPVEEAPVHTTPKEKSKK
jgi:hypothetical protein